MAIDTNIVAARAHLDKVQGMLDAFLRACHEGVEDVPIDADDVEHLRGLIRAEREASQRMLDVCSAWHQVKTAKALREAEQGIHSARLTAGINFEIERAIAAREV